MSTLHACCFRRTGIAPPAAFGNIPSTGATFWREAVVTGQRAGEGRPVGVSLDLGEVRHRPGARAGPRAGAQGGWRAVGLAFTVRRRRRRRRRAQARERAHRPRNLPPHRRGRSPRRFPSAARSAFSAGSPRAETRAAIRRGAFVEVASFFSSMRGCSPRGDSRRAGWRRPRLFRNASSPSPARRSSAGRPARAARTSGR